MKRIEAERREKRQNHRNAPAARNRMLMNVPSARLVHIAQARQHTNADPRQQHRQAAAEQWIQHQSPIRREKIKQYSHQYVFSFTSAFISPFSSFAGNGGHDFSRPYGQYGMLEEQGRPSHRPEPETRKKSHRFRTAARNRFNGVPSIRIIKKRSSVPGSQPGEACRSGD